MRERKSAPTHTTASDDAMIDLAPACKIAARLISESRDRELSAMETQSLHKHLDICKSCARFDAQLDFLSELARRYARGEAGRKR